MFYDDFMSYSLKEMVVKVAKYKMKYEFASFFEDFNFVKSYNQN